MEINNNSENIDFYYSNNNSNNNNGSVDTSINIELLEINNNISNNSFINNDSSKNNNIENIEGLNDDNSAGLLFIDQNQNEISSTNAINDLSTNYDIISCNTNSINEQINDNCNINSTNSIDNYDTYDSYSSYNIFNNNNSNNNNNISRNNNRNSSNSNLRKSIKDIILMKRVKLNKDTLKNKKDMNKDNKKPTLQQQQHQAQSIPQQQQEEDIQLDLTCSFENLPDELILSILSYLDPISLGRLSMVCKNLNIITYDAALWKYVIRNWQNETINKMKKTKYAKNPSANIKLLLEPPIILDQEGEIVVRPIPQINSAVYPSSRNSLRRFQPINGQFINQNQNNHHGLNYHLNNRNIQTPPPPQFNFPQFYNQMNYHNNNNQNINTNNNINNQNTNNISNNNLNTANNSNNSNNSSNNSNLNNSTSNNNIIINQKPSSNHEPNCKSYYIESFIKIKTQLSDRMELIKKQKKQEQRMKSISRSTKVMFFTFFSRPCEWLSAALIILFTIFMGFKLDNYIDWSWPIIFLPLLFVTLQCLCSPLIFVFFRTIYNHQYEEELSPDSCLKPLFFSLFFILPLQPSEKLYKILLFTPIISIILFIVLLVCKLTLENFAMIYVFIPIFVLSVYLIAFTLCFPERIDYSLEWLDQFSMTICSLLFFVFNILLFLKVDEAVDIKWIYIFSPLFVIKAIAMIYPCIIRIMYHTSLDFWLDQKTGWFREPGSLTLVIVFFVLVSCPLFVFEIMLIQNLSFQTTYKYSLVLIPIYFIEFLSICGCFFINVAFSSNTE